MNWIISQKWEHACFLNFSIKKEELQKCLPKGFEVDTYSDLGWLSIVSFKMSQVRLAYLPTFPFSSLWELNLRTYVRYKNKPGIYFFSLDSSHFLANFIARFFFHLPYRNKKIKSQMRLDGQTLSSVGDFELDYKIGRKREKTVFDSWITERYCLFTKHKEQFFEGRVHHPSWELREVDNLKWSESLRTSFQLPNSADCDSSFYSKGFRVYFEPFKKI